MLSAGQKRRAAMVRVLLSNASLWLLDEPFTNLDVAGVELFASLLAEHAAGGGVVLATTHQPIPALGVRTLELA
jgi:heme exporter protein A